MEFGYITKFHGIPWNPYIRWEVPWNSMKLRKFHGTWSDTKFHGIPWNSRAAKWAFTKFHRIPWNFNGTLVPPYQIPQSSIEFNEIVISIDTRFLWTSVKFKGNLKITFRLTSGSSWRYMEYFMEFHETLASTNQISPSSMEFHGTRRVPFQITQSSMEFHGIPWNSGVVKSNTT